jgi:hypothetical protein
VTTRWFDERSILRDLFDLFSERVVEVHARQKKILAASDIADDVPLWRAHHTEPGFGSGAVYLYAVLRGCPKIKDLLRKSYFGHIFRSLLLNRPAIRLK